MNIPQMRSNVLKIKQELGGRKEYLVYSALDKLTNLMEDIVDAMDEKGKLVSEVSVGKETYRTYVTDGKPTKRQRAINSLIEHAESLDW